VADLPETTNWPLRFAQISEKRLADALREAVATIEDYLDHKHNGDPSEEDARLMGEMDINDYGADGRLVRAQKLLAERDRVRANDETLWAAGTPDQDGGLGMFAGPSNDRAAVVASMSDGDELVQCSQEGCGVVGVMQDGRVQDV